MRFRSILILTLLIVSAPGVFAEDLSIEDQIKETLAAGRRVAGEELRTLQSLSDFYGAREYKPVWVRDNNVTSLGKDLIKAIGASSKEGLPPELYRLSKIEELVGRAEKPLLADIELLLSDAFFSLGFHYAYGAIDPDTGKLRWFEPPAAGKLKVVLDTVVSTGNAEGSLSSLLPKNQPYIELRNALARYVELASKTKWPKIAGLAKGTKINLGDEDERIEVIRERLGVVKKVSANERHNPNIYDEGLLEAVVKFQRENGLLDDGVIGYRTVDAMNVSVEDRVCQIKLNLDRHRALANIWDEPSRVVVNIPAFWLETYENGNLVLDMKIIDGMVARKTPTLSSEIVHLIFSPKWYVPDKILFEDKLKHIKDNPAWLKQHGMRVYEKGGGEVDPESIDWTQFQSQHHIPYRVVQGSGDLNALGRVKFIFPNPYDVYLHDTPDKRLFKNAQRTFSSGCMRIEKPVELAQLLLKDKPNWTAEKISDAMNRNYEQVVPLTKPMPIHVVYVTAWVDKNGTLEFRDDVYGYDNRYKKILCD